MPVLKNISGCRLCLQNGSVVLPGRTVYVPSIENSEIANAISAKILAPDKGLPPAEEQETQSSAEPDMVNQQIVDQPSSMQRPEVPKQERTVIANPLSERPTVVDGAKVYTPDSSRAKKTVVDGIEVYTPDDQYDVVDGVKVIRSESPEYDPGIFIDMDKI
jgi:hypothetical protein